MGFTLQSIAPPVQPFAVSDAFALLALERPPTVPKTNSPVANAEAPRQSSPAPIMERPLKRPSPSGLCSTRESATPGRLFRPTQARSSPGLHPLQGVPPHRYGTAFTAPPLLRLSSQATNRPTGRPYRVLLPGEVGLSLSRLPTLMGFPAS
jgi:hypothetical protein